MRKGKRTKHLECHLYARKVNQFTCTFTKVHYNHLLNAIIIKCNHEKSKTNITSQYVEGYFITQ